MELATRGLYGCKLPCIGNELYIKSQEYNIFKMINL